MAKFGLACEGITDQIVIENILFGFYDKYDDLDDKIQPFQPAYDETDKKQKEGEFGGWEMLLQYLSEERFRDDVLNSEYTIIQIDTDISEHKNFNVKIDTSSIENYISNIRDKIINFIDKKEKFYNLNKDKIIFAISVHSLECWILPIYKTLTTEKILNCDKALEIASTKIKVNKNYNTYNKLTKLFLKKKNLDKFYSQNKSFTIFINSLPKTID